MRDLGVTVISIGTVARLKSPTNTPSRDAAACTHLLPVHQCKGAQAPQGVYPEPDQPYCQPPTHGGGTAPKAPASRSRTPPSGAAPPATSRWRPSTAAGGGQGPAGLPGPTLWVLSVPAMNVEEFLPLFDFIFFLTRISMSAYCCTSVVIVFPVHPFQGKQNKTNPTLLKPLCFVTSSPSK